MDTDRVYRITVILLDLAHINLCLTVLTYVCTSQTRCGVFYHQAVALPVADVFEAGGVMQAW